MVGIRLLALALLLAAAACSSGGGGSVTQVAEAVEIPGALFLDSRNSILSFTEMRNALGELNFPINSGSRPTTIEGTYSFRFRYGRHTLDLDKVGAVETMELAFNSQGVGSINYRLGAPGGHTVINGFLSGGAANFPGQPVLDTDFTVAGVIVSSESMLGLPCRERNAVVISGRMDAAGDLKLRMIVMAVRIEADCLNAVAGAGFDPMSIPGEHIMIIGDAIRVGP